MITVTLPANTEVKVVYFDGNGITIWYPDPAPNLNLPCQTYTIYFRPDGQGGDDWYYHCLYAKHNHVLTDHAATAATCTTEGNTAYWSCANCGKYFSDAQGTNEIVENSWVTLIDSDAHAWGEWTVTTPATCTTEGVETRVCANDPTHTETRPVDMLPAVAKIGETKYETFEAAWNAAADGNTITLLADCAGNGLIAPQGKYTTGLTVDFDHHTYTVTGNLVGSTGTETQAFQLLKDNKITFKDGTITSAKAKMLVQNYSNLTLDNMTLDGANLPGSHRYVLSNNNGNVVIKDTTITAKSGDVAFDVCRYSSYPSVNVTVTGDSEINGNVEVDAGNGDAKDGFSLTLESGEMNGNIVLTNGAKAAMAATPEKATVTKDANFTAAAPADYEWENGTLVAKVYVAQIGETKYETLEAAFAAAQDGNTITVLANCSGNGIKVPEGKFTTGLTVDFGGHTYGFSGKGVGSSGTEYNGFQLLRDNTITFTNGKITATSEDAGFLIQNYSNLTLDGMTIDGTGVWGGYAMSNNNGNVVINDTTITAKAGDVAFDVCRYSSYPSVSVTVTGSSVINGDVEVSASNNDAKDGLTLTLTGGTMNGSIVLDESAETAMAATPAKATVTKAAGFTATAPADYEWDANGKLVPIEYVAKIGNTEYETLEAAFAAAVDGDTITLLSDCTGNGIQVLPNRFQTNGLTVDFGGFTYTVDGETVGSPGTKTQAFQLQQNNKITFQNGTIYSEKALMLVQNYSNLTLDNMTLDGSKLVGSGRYTLSNNNGNVVIDSSTIIAKEGEGNFAFDVCRYASYPSVSVTVTGNSQINGDVEISASGSDPKNGFSLALNGGTMTGDIVLDATAETAMATNPAGETITKATAFVQDAPEGYMWVAAGEGTQTIAKAVATLTHGQTTTSYATLEAAFAAAVDGDTITLLANTSGNGIQVLPNRFQTNGLTVDFGGFTYTVDGETVGSPGTKTQAFQLQQNNKITFQNGTIYSEKALMLVQNYSNLTLDNMTLDGSKLVGSGRYTLSNNNGNVVIDSSTIIAKEGEGNFAFDVCRYASYPSVSVTVTGNSQINGDVEISASGSDPKNGFSLTLTSGTLNGDIVVDASAAAAMATTPAKATVTKADTFTQEAPADYEWVDNGNGTSTLVAIVYAAQIGNNKYRTLEAAVAAAVDGDTITLLADCEGNGIVFPQGKFGTTGLTIDFDGHTYNVSGTPVGSTGTETIGFQLLKDNKITLQNGTLYGDCTNNPRNGRKLQRMIQNYSDLTLNNMTISMKGQYYNQITMSNCNGATVIHNSTVNAPDFTWAGYDDPADVGGAAFTVGTFSTYTAASVAVTGTSTINGDIIVDPSTNAEHNTLTLTSGTLSGNIVMKEDAANATVTKDEGFGATAPEGYRWSEAEGGVQTLAPIPYVAQIGETKYESLAEAFAAAADDDTITLLADVALTERLFVNAGATPAYAGSNNRYATTSENKAITLDLNGHNITSDSNIALAGGSLNITGTGTISTTGSGLAPIEIRGTGDLTSKRTLTIGANVILDSTSRAYGLNVFGSNDAQKNIIDVTVHGTVHGTLFVLGNLKNTANEINIEVNGTVAAPAAAANESPNVGIALNGVANVTVNEGAAVSGDSGIEVRAGSLTVNGGTITATAGEYSYTANNSGCTTKGAAIAVAAYGTTIPTTATLNGGTLNGVKKIGVTDVNDDMSNVTVTATQSFTQNSTIPEGYEWVETENPGTYTLEEIPVEVAAFSAEGGSLATEGRIIVRIWTKAVAGSTVDHVTLTINGRTETVPYTAGLESGDYKIFSMPVYAKEMDDDVVLKAFDANNQQLKIFSAREQDLVDEYTYSVKTYVNTMPSDADYKAFVEAMATYGDHAKYYFDHPYGTSSMPHSDLTYIDYAVLDEYQAVTGGDSIGDLAYVGGALGLEEGTYIRVFFSGSIDGVTFSCNGVNLTPVAYGAYHYVTIDNVAAKDLDTMYTISATDGTNTYTVQYSALTYVRSVLSNNSNPQTLKDVVTALYWYNKEANEFFH